MSRRRASPLGSLRSCWPRRTDWSWKPHRASEPCRSLCSRGANRTLRSSYALCSRRPLNALQSRSSIVPLGRQQFPINICGYRWFSARRARWNYLATPGGPSIGNYIVQRVICGYRSPRAARLQTGWTGGSGRSLRSSRAIQPGRPLRAGGSLCSLGPSRPGRS